MEIKPEFEASFKNHLFNVICSHVIKNAGNYADVALTAIKDAPEGIDDVTIRVDIKFAGICSQFKQYQAERLGDA
jgi:hypothetical protein